MDLRVQRTKRHITDAFLCLRAKKSLESITVTELAQLAEINKATFYLHYQDIFDLSDKLENEIISDIVSTIPHTEDLLSGKAVPSLFLAFLQQDQLCHTLFDGRINVFADKIEQEIKTRVYEIHPERETDVKWNTLLSFLVQGSFHAFQSNAKHGTEEVLRYLSLFSSLTLQNPLVYSETTPNS